MKFPDPRSSRRRWLCHALHGLLATGGALGVAGLANAQSGPAPAGQGTARLPAPETWDATLARAAGQGRVVVMLWGTAGCPWCDALRREVMIHLWRDASRRWLEVFEFDLADRRALSSQPDTNPAALAERFRIRVSPTVSFHGPEGELAARLVGYTSRDFYPAYLEERIEAAQKRLKNR